MLDVPFSLRPRKPWAKLIWWELASSDRESQMERFTISSSLSYLKEIGCKMSWPVHISPLSCANMNNYWLENRETG
ncbi:MAG: hypothetical protein Q8N74_01775 [Sulfuricella sp.]|nr:hypothetical protein [Sulfuricella sp.]